MKKILVFMLAFLILGIFFVASVSAEDSAPDPYIPPVYEEGDPSLSGYWSPVTGNIRGTFTTWIGLSSELLYREYTIEYPWQILRDDRDEFGNGVCFWILNVNFEYGFGYMSTEPDFHTLQIVLRSYDQEPRGYLNDVNVLTHDGLSKEVIFHAGNGFDDTQVTYARDRWLFFGTAGDNRPYFDDYSTEFIITFFTQWFSGPFVNGGIYQQAGFFKPVVYSTFVPEDPVSDPAGGFSAFMSIIFNFFADLLSIDFFAGFFSLGDVLGVVIAFALILLFVKWFAGG